MKSNWIEDSLVNAQLKVVDDVINNHLTTDFDILNQIRLHLFRGGGKKIRPSLYLLSLKYGDYFDKELLVPAAALEMLHVASLYHDDIIDQASSRRGVPSVNIKWGNHSAAYAANGIIAKALHTLSQYNSNINGIVCKYIKDLCIGQLKEAENAYNIDVKLEEYLTVIQFKTASLFELPCILAGLLSNASQVTIENLKSFAFNLGMAFQIKDDLLDLTGDISKTGKHKGIDLIEGIYSYPTIKALNQKQFRNQLMPLLLLDNITKDEVEQSIKIIEESGGISMAKDAANKYLSKANYHLELLGNNDSKSSFENLINYVIVRNE